MRKRKICVFTGTRAEYGILSPLMKEIKNDTGLELGIIVSGMHLLAKFGNTYKEIEKDGFFINEKAKMPLISDTEEDVANAIGKGIITITSAIKKIKPDILVLLGDRFECLAAAISAMILRIPIAHIHGGEVTEGVVDEAIRHSITKMSHFHFVSCREYALRVRQLGENPKKIFKVGALGLDNIKAKKLMTKEDIQKKINFKCNKKNLLITYHPVTLEKNMAQFQFANLLEILDCQKDTNLIFTKANADMGGGVINSLIDDYVKNNKNKAIAFISMGQENYLSTMKYMDGVVGNSSSGIIEAPSFKVGTIDIGDRQKGRIKADSVISCLPEIKSFKRAFIKLYSKDFQKKLKQVKNPYGLGGTAVKIKNILKKVETKGILKKEFYDI